MVKMHEESDNFSNEIRCLEEKMQEDAHSHADAVSHYEARMSDQDVKIDSLE